MARSLLLPLAAMLLLAVAVRAYTPEDPSASPAPEEELIVVDDPGTVEYPDGEVKPEPVMYTTTDVKPRGYKPYKSYYSPSDSIYESCDLEAEPKITGNGCALTLQCACKCTKDNAVVDKKTGARVTTDGSYGVEDEEPCMCPKTISLCNCPEYYSLDFNRRGALVCTDGEIPNECVIDEPPCVREKPYRPAKFPGKIKYKVPKTWNKNDPAYFDSYPKGKGSDYGYGSKYSSKYDSSYKGYKSDSGSEEDPAPEEEVLRRPAVTAKTTRTVKPPARRPARAKAPARRNTRNTRG